MKKIILIFVAFGFSIALVIIGCRKENPSNSHSNLPSIKVNGKRYDCINLHFKPKVNKNNKSIGSNYTVKGITINFDRAGMEGLFSDVKQNFTGDIQNEDSVPKIIILYANDTLTNIHFDSLKGISFFVKTNQQMIHKYFSVSSGNTTEDTTYEKTGTYFSLWNIDYLTKQNNDNPNVGWALFHTESQNETPSISY